MYQQGEYHHIVKTSKEKQEDFIMLPTVDFCFKELMQNDNIRKNIIAALLNVPSSEIENTELMPTILRKESKDDKYGILDVRVKLKDGEQIEKPLIVGQTVLCII